MNLDSGAENLFDIKAETVIAGNQKLHSYLPHITIPDIDQNITEKVSPQLKVAQSNLLIRNGFDKEWFDKEQIGVKEPFLLTNLPIYIIRVRNIWC